MLAAALPGSLESGLLYVALAVYAGASLVGIRVLLGGARTSGLATMLGVGTAALTLTLLLGALRQGGVPLEERQSLLLLCAWILSLGFSLVRRTVKHAVLAAIVAPTLTLLLFAALLVAARPASPAFSGHTFATTAHILMAVVSCSAFTLAAATGALYLLQIRVLKRDPASAVSRRLPPLETLDRLNFLSVAIGFPFLILSIAAGWTFVFRSTRPAGDWLLDPTVLATGAGAVVYLGLFSARAFLGWRGRRVALLSLVGFAVVVVGFIVASFCPAAVHGS
ncbi:MAG: cytochrome c biogenesis protein CcsA [Planctomycetaceae bacterium]